MSLIRIYGSVLGLSLTIIFSLVGCGDEAAFVDVSAESTEGQPDGVSDTGNIPTGEEGPGDANPDPDLDPDDPTEPPVVTLPGLEKKESSAVKECLTKWGKVPFGNTINVRKINAAITVGGFGNAVNDTARTEEPELVLIKAAVNVGSDVVYRLENPNGYYCMMVNVNVDTTLDIYLNCQSRLADNKVSVDVGSDVDPGAAEIGVNIGSEVNIHNVSNEEDQCIR